MSDNWINLIPENPEFVPTPENQRLAEGRCRELAPQADEITSKSTASIQFRDCGTNLEDVSCPHCGDDLFTDWWQNAMNRDRSGIGFLLKPQELPCCGNTATLHELIYRFAEVRSAQAGHRMVDSQTDGGE